MKKTDPPAENRPPLLTRLWRAIVREGKPAPEILYADSEFRIRTLEESDLPALEWNGEYAHFRRLFRQAYEDMRAGSRLLLVLERLPAAAIIGQVFIQWSSSDFRLADGTGRGYLYALRVQPDYRGRGLGTRLLRAAEDSLRAHRMRYASIGVEKTNLRARALYERLGYRLIGEDPGRWSYIDHRGEQQEVSEPAWLLEKKLDDAANGLPPAVMPRAG
jgi:ribosomal protein S18 acetylase RimI-like enzyme